MFSTTYAADRPSPVLPRAIPVGQLLGYELAWEHQASGCDCDYAGLRSLALERWQTEGHELAGADADFAMFLQGFLEAYRTG